jgi:putative ABC transport system ATP-binding protein
MIGLEFENVTKKYPGPPSTTALEGVSFQVKRGEFVAIVGPSGSGKTTLLNLASGLDRKYEGSVKVVGEEVRSFSRTALAQFRSQRIGFIFQAYNLFPTLNAVENVEFTSLMRGDSPKESRERAIQALSDVGLAEKIHAFPNQLSGGQQQRVAVARALATEPELIFADEPTANLDSKTAAQLISLFKSLNETRGLTFVFSTHDRDLISQVNRLIQIKDGRLEA